MTPGFSWKQNRGDTIGSTGSDYSKASRAISKIAGTDITEIPFNSVTDRSLGVTGFSAGNVLRAVKHVLFGRKLQLRPDGRNLKDMLRFLELAENDGHLMFMLHSSELMPGGSPTFKTREDIEKLYQTSGVYPEINQIVIPVTNLDNELTTNQLIRYCKEKKILLQAAMPFGGEAASCTVDTGKRQDILTKLRQHNLTCVIGTRNIQHLYQDIAWIALGR